jgi:periplasmic divalent cation tolerance protein
VDAILVFITAADDAEAARIADALLAARLAACVSRVSEIDSRFWWQGKTEQAHEALLMVKSRRALWPELLETVRAHHSYDVFEALAIPIVEGNPDYLRWVEESTTKDKANSE